MKFLLKDRSQASSHHGACLSPQLCVWYSKQSLDNLFFYLCHIVMFHCFTLDEIYVFIYKCIIYFMAWSLHVLRMCVGVSKAMSYASTMPQDWVGKTIFFKLCSRKTERHFVLGFVHSLLSRRFGCVFKKIYKILPIWNLFPWPSVKAMKRVQRIENATKELKNKSFILSFF